MAACGAGAWLAAAPSRKEQRRRRGYAWQRRFGDDQAVDAVRVIPFTRAKGPGEQSCAGGTAALPSLRVSAADEAGCAYRDVGGPASLARRAPTVVLIHSGRPGKDSLGPVVSSIARFQDYAAAMAGPVSRAAGPHEEHEMTDTLNCQQMGTYARRAIEAVRRS